MAEDLKMACHKMRALDWALFAIIVILAYIAVILCLNTMQLVKECGEDRTTAMEEYGNYMDNQPYVQRKEAGSERKGPHRTAIKM